MWRYRAILLVARSSNEVMIFDINIKRLKIVSHLQIINPSLSIPSVSPLPSPINLPDVPHNPLTHRTPLHTFSRTLPTEREMHTGQYHPFRVPLPANHTVLALLPVLFDHLEVLKVLLLQGVELLFREVGGGGHWGQ
jgi:hypothetical protein